MNLAELNQRYAIADHLHFTELAGGLVIAEIANAHATASLALQGAHVMTFLPRGEEPVLWLSPDARYAPGKSIRGGVPICWPWFGAHASDASLPGHGFARTVPWQVLETRALPDGASFVRCGLIETAATRTQWPHPSTVEIEVTVGRTLHLALVTHNSGSEPFTLGEALHTYFQVSDVAQMRIGGLEGCTYLDKVGTPTRRIQQGPVRIDGEVDRVYVDTDADCIIEDAAGNRAIRIAKSGSGSTVVWNPWEEKAEKMGDLGPNGYRHMVCVESGNAVDNVVSVAPGATHRLAVTYSTEPLA